MRRMTGVRVQVVHSAELRDGDRRVARSVLEEAFEGDFGAEDWAHSLGGMHALAWDGTVLAGHAAVVQRQLVHEGRALRTGYVEGVGVRADMRRRGIASAMMAELERVVRGAYELGALSASEGAEAFYAGRGWQVWHGPTWALTLQGVVRTAEEDGGVMVLPVASGIRLSGSLICDYREGDLW